MVVWPRDELDEPAIVFRKYFFSVRVLPPKLSPTRRAGAARPGRRPRARLAARQSGCSAVLPLHMPKHRRGSSVPRLLFSAALFGCSEETQTTLHRHPSCDAHRRLRDALRCEAPERGRRLSCASKTAICRARPGRRRRWAESSSWQACSSTRSGTRRPSHHPVGDPSEARVRAAAQAQTCNAHACGKPPTLTLTPDPNPNNNPSPRLSP